MKKSLFPGMDCQRKEVRIIGKLEHSVFCVLVCVPICTAVCLVIDKVFGG